MSLPVRGAWIEIPLVAGNSHTLKRRSPCGERGLKYFIHLHAACGGMSLPVRGAWIEMTRCFSRLLTLLSLPVRGAWIEIYYARVINQIAFVAPRAGSVD